jgi:hypothetical protein
MPALFWLTGQLLADAGRRSVPQDYFEVSIVAATLMED